MDTHSYSVKIQMILNATSSHLPLLYGVSWPELLKFFCVALFFFPICIGLELKYGSIFCYCYCCNYIGVWGVFVYCKLKDRLNAKSIWLKFPTWQSVFWWVIVMDETVHLPCQLPLPLVWFISGISFPDLSFFCLVC